MASIGERMTKVENDLSALKDTMHIRMTAIEENTAAIRDAVTFTKNGFGYVKKYGPKALTFGAGLMTAAGIGNPHILSFITQYFS